MQTRAHRYETSSERSQRRTRRSAMVFVLATALALVVLIAFNHSSEAPLDDAETAGPSPAASHAFRKKMAAAKRRAPPLAPPTPSGSQHEVQQERPTKRVFVSLKSSVDGLLMTARRGSLDPAAFWPLPEEAPFPKGQTAPELQQLIHDQAEPTSPAERAWLDVAWEEGLSPESVDISEDPWAGVLALEVARRGSRMEHLDLYHQALDDGLGPENGMITARALVGPPQVSDLLALADDMIDAYPEHPAAEFARLYLLRATALRGQSEDISEAWHTAQDLLRNTDDALVLGQAVGLLATLPGNETLSGEDLDQVAQVLTEEDDLVDPIDVSVFALNQALKREDGPRSRQWAARFEEYLAAFCSVEHQSPRCDQHRDNLDLAVAYIGDLGTADAKTWRQAFQIAAYTCARAGYLEPYQRIQVLVGWEGDHWDFPPWTPRTTPLARCIETEIPLGPQPDEAPFNVHLTVIPPY